MDGNTEGRRLREEAAAFSFGQLQTRSPGKASAADRKFLDILGDLAERVGEFRTVRSLIIVLE